ncbi:hypothetical protein EXIGLDRAFT_777220 [Exidia glandulosa HHB12029]|uniref:Uncharacterized protein n=1 Tax=Exidia glandulosa HHB12029 TaxID=1314781 RepID=A0A165D4M2_EXIGL|nr:hypothetical protein EXIGLDRAFT_777220 [Exidia glandulosa HHB12029]
MPLIFSARHTPATPSISLERGVSRLRAPRLHNQSSSSSVRIVFDTPTLVWITLGFLSCAAMVSFGFAWWLVRDSESFQRIRQ